MTPGCTNPLAVNYDPAADQDDASCLYLSRANDICYVFKDVAPASIDDKSFTLSFSFNNTDWVFFHDYIPDFYFRTRNQLYNLKNKKIYAHHQGPPGVFHTDEVKPFFVDAMFTSEEEITLNSIQWMTEMMSNDHELPFKTITHITVWNNQQCSGRIPISDIFKDLEYEARKTQGVWSFDTFRDMVAVYGTKFLKDIFNNFDVDSSKINPDKPWYEQSLMQDTWFIIRFEFDNISEQEFIFHGAELNASKSYR